MPEYLALGLLCEFSIVILVCTFDGINRVFTQRDTAAQYDDLTRRGFIVR